jgi:hypothetical protein
MKKILMLAFASSTLVLGACSSPMEPVAPQLSWDAAGGDCIDSVWYNKAGKPTGAWCQVQPGSDGTSGSE